MKKRTVIFFSLILFLYFFVVYDTNFYGPDSPIYFAYTASVVEDGDLNAVNNIGGCYQYYCPAERKAEVSRTYNLPDPRNHGGVILWAPFYAYGKFIHSIAAANVFPLNIANYEIKKVIKSAMAFSTAVFGFLSVILTYLLCRRFFSNKISAWANFVIFFGTPFWYYTLFENANANIVASLFSVLSIWLCISGLNKKRLYWFFYGVFFSICMVIKLDLWFQLIFIFSFFIIYSISKQIALKNGIYFTIGMIPAVALMTANNYIKYGTMHMGELGLINLKDNYLFEQLFSSNHGFFYTSPVFYICLLGFIILTINFLKKSKFTDSDERLKDIFCFILTLYLIVKIILIGNRFAWGVATIGARPLLTEFPVFVLLYAYFFQRQKSGTRLFFICIISVLCILWNLLIISEYISQVDLDYIVKAPALYSRFANLKYIVSQLFFIKDFDLKLKICAPLSLAVFLMIFYINKLSGLIPVRFWKKSSSASDPRLCFFYLFTVYLFSAYFIITLLNISNNKKNAEILKQEGFLNNVKIIGPREFEKIENMGSMAAMSGYFKRIGKADKANKIQKYMALMYGE